MSVSIQTGCAAPLGMDSGAITDAQISASSQWDGNHGARQGRLHYKKLPGTSGSWSSRANDLNQWFQVDLGQYTTVTGIATQGRQRYDQYVTAYKLQYSDDGVTFQFYKASPLEAEKVYLVSSIVFIFKTLRTSLCKNQTSWEMKVFNPPSNFACS